MRKYWYIIPMVLCITLLLPNKAEAATTQNSITSGSYTIQYQTYNDIVPTSSYQTTDIGNLNNQYNQYQYNIDENIILRGFTTGKFYNGSINIKFTHTYTSINSYQMQSILMQNNQSTNGVYAFISAQTNTQFNVKVIFDNYQSQGVVGLPSIALTLVRQYTSSTLGTFTFSVSVDSNTITETDIAINNSLSAQIYNAITQGTYQEFEDIITLLTQIRANDLNYYNLLVTGLNTVDIDLDLIYLRLNDFYTRNHNDFTAVQTVLDLFPNYITQVLSYWQQLLNMNAQQQSEADAQNQEYANHESEANNAMQGASVTMPEQGNISLNINDQIDTTQQNNFFGFLSLIANNGFITTLLLIGVTAMIAGYILYGKK